MKAIILAAGISRRMRPLTDDMPKSLLEVGDETILNRQIRILMNVCESIVVVVGYKKEKVINILPAGAKAIINNAYKHTNSIYSLWLARKEFGDDLLLLNSDVIFDENLIGDLKDTKDGICVALSTDWQYDKGYKVEGDNKRVKRMGMEMSKEKILGEYAGIIKIKKEKVPVLTEYLKIMLNESEEYWFEDVFSRMAGDRVDIGFFDVKKYLWFEVDTVEEYLAAGKAIASLETR